MGPLGYVSSSFPLTKFFDTVAPYYPVTFSPLPNNPYGITSEGLQSSLMALLCHINHGHDHNDGVRSSKTAPYSSSYETITSHAARLFIDTLSPHPSSSSYSYSSSSSCGTRNDGRGGGVDMNDDADNDSFTVQDRANAASDLIQLLLRNKEGKMVVSDGNPLHNIGLDLERELSDILIRVYNSAVSNLMSLTTTDEGGE